MHGAEPGTGTQIACFASPSDVDDGNDSTYRVDGRLWKCGEQYLDTEIGDVATLVEVVGKSSWCSTRDAEDCPPMLVFEYERYEYGPIKIDALDPSGEVTERFIERYTPDPPRGM
jgi:hypothetical protein